MGTQPSLPVLVLAVDDEENMVKFVGRVLREAGYTVKTATSGPNALQIVEQDGVPQLLVTDLKMPIMEGDQLAARLRKLNPDMRVLYFTGFADALFKQKHSLWDGEAFLDKPASVNGLLEAVALLLHGHLRGGPRH